MKAFQNSQSCKFFVELEHFFSLEYLTFTISSNALNSIPFIDPLPCSATIDGIELVATVYWFSIQTDVVVLYGQYPSSRTLFCPASLFAELFVCIGNIFRLSTGKRILPKPCGFGILVTELPPFCLLPRCKQKGIEASFGIRLPCEIRLFFSDVAEEI